MLLRIVRLAMAVFVILGALCTISMMFFFLNVNDPKQASLLSMFVFIKIPNYSF
jgi:hypothetical protein